MPAPSGNSLVDMTQALFVRVGIDIPARLCDAISVRVGGSPAMWVSLLAQRRQIAERRPFFSRWRCGFISGSKYP